METNERATYAIGSRRGGNRWLWTMVVLALVLGIFLGRWGASGSTAIAADPTVDATATRSAELDELNALRTQVAQPAVCTPAPTETPTAVPSPTATPTEVPASAMGVAVDYNENWQIAALGIQPATAPDNLEVDGQLMKVTLNFKNTSNTSQLPPMNYLRLVDSSGNAYPVDTKATLVVGSSDYSVRIAAQDSHVVSIVFDVAKDAGSSFQLISTKEPTFKVGLTIEARG